MARSGRSVSRRASRSSGQPRSWSASVRGGAACSVLDIPSTLLAEPTPGLIVEEREGSGMKPVDLHHGAATDVGHVRTVNEDSFLVAPPVFVVADGMGGHAGGDVASRIVVEEFARLVEEGYDPSPGRRARLRHHRPRAGPDRRVRRRAAHRAPALARRHHRRGGRARRRRRHHQVAARQPRRLPHLPLHRRPPRPGQRRPLGGPGAGRRRPDHRRAGRRSTPSGT